MRAGGGGGGVATDHTQKMKRMTRGNEQHATTGGHAPRNTARGGTVQTGARSRARTAPGQRANQQPAAAWPVTIGSNSPQTKRRSSSQAQEATLFGCGRAGQEDGSRWETRWTDEQPTKDKRQ